MKMLSLTFAFVFLTLSTGMSADSEAPGTPLHLAVIMGDIATVTQHIEAGTDLNLRDDFGSTPLVIAAVFDRPDISRALLAAGADATIRDPQGSTPLHIAALLGRTGVVRSLMDAGVERYARSASGAMAFDYAAAPLPEEQAIYDVLRDRLAPIGFRLDDAETAAAKPVIARMLRSSPAELRNVTYAPENRADFPVSTPAAEGLDPTLVAELYRDAEASPRLYSILVVKNGKLVAERYFNEGGIDTPTLIQSAAKSIFSALVGLARREGCLPDLDARILDFLPEVSGQLSDPRKSRITIRHLLQMRSGLPWEETDPELWDLLMQGDHLAPLRDFPLLADPGVQFNYSNFSTDLLGVIVAKACGMDLDEFASTHLLQPLGVRFGKWERGSDYHYPLIHITPRTAARFAQLYLDGGIYDGKQVIPPDWVSASLADYSEDASGNGRAA